MTGRFLLGEVHALPCARVELQKKKREQAPALNTELSTGVSIAEDRGKSKENFADRAIEQEREMANVSVLYLALFLGSRHDGPGKAPTGAIDTGSVQGNLGDGEPKAARGGLEDFKLGSEQSGKALAVEALQLDLRNSLAPVLEGLVVGHGQEKFAAGF